MSRRTLLIDADVVAYESAFSCEKAFEFEPGYWTWQVEFDEVLTAFDAEVERMMETLKASDFKLCLTDSDGNFRLGIHRDYKGGRKSVRKPIVLKHLKQFLIDERQAFFKPGLEGDDCMGILATHPKLIPGEKVIVSIDKDMKTIPGLFVRWGAKEEAGIVEISENQAAYFHMTQTLTGDVTDGYKGLPGCGPKKAEAILAGDFNSPDELWPLVRAAYEKAGLTEDDAIIQARMAKILDAAHYDFKKQEPILWNPPS
jgi:DNA polymerase-1